MAKLRTQTTLHRTGSTLPVSPHAINLVDPVKSACGKESSRVGILPLERGDPRRLVSTIENWALHLLRAKGFAFWRSNAMRACPRNAHWPDSAN